jgi:hypothetical protein
MVVLHFMHYNCCRIHQALRVTPSMQAGLADHVWELEELVKLIDRGAVQCWCEAVPHLAARRSRGFIFALGIDNCHLDIRLRRRSCGSLVPAILPISRPQLFVLDIRNSGGNTCPLVLFKSFGWLDKHELL